MDAETRTWNMQMIKEVMTATDATLVKGIPLRRKSKLDKLKWYDSMTGVFSVKSAYHVARRVLGKEEINTDHRDKMWKQIWTAKVAPKLKYFV